MSPKPPSLSDDDVAMLTRLESGEHTYRPGTQPRPGEDFDWLVVHLLSLRQRGLVRFPDSRIMKRQDGRVIGIGPVDLTSAGLEALARDRRRGRRLSTRGLQARKTGQESSNSPGPGCRTCSLVG